MAKRNSTQIAPGRPTSDTKNSTNITGFSGLKMSGGLTREEFLPALRGRQGMKILVEMRDNDPIVGAVLFAITMLIRQAEWEVVPYGPENEHQLRADAVRTMIDDMGTTWSDILSEILSMLPFGWAFMEVAYKKRAGYTHGDDPMSSRYSDGFIGWQNFSICGQDTLQKWIQDKTSGIVTGWEQQDDEGRKATLMLSKGMLFRTTSYKGNPEGRSILRNSYRPWYFKKRLEEIEAIGIERDLNGIPVMTSPEGTNIWDAGNPEMVAYRSLAEDIVKNLRRDEQAGIILPFGWDLKLLASESSRAVDTTGVIGRYNNAIAMTCLADFIVLGHNNRYGSKALAGNKTAMFQSSITGWTVAIADVLNRIALPKLFALNAWPVDQLPTMKPKGLNLPDLEALGSFLSHMSAAGFKMFPNIPLEEAVLQLAGLPYMGLTLGQEKEVVDDPTGAGAKDDTSEPDGDPDVDSKSVDEK